MNRTSAFVGGRIPDRGNSLQRFGERNEKHTLVIKVVKLECGVPGEGQGDAEEVAGVNLEGTSKVNSGNSRVSSLTATGSEG